MYVCMCVRVAHKGERERERERAVGYRMQLSQKQNKQVGNSKKRTEKPREGRERTQRSAQRYIR